MAELFDRWGRPIVTAKKPAEARVAVMGRVDKYSDYPSRGLTPAKLGTIFRAADEGDLSLQAELFGEMEEKDGHLSSVLQTRKLAVIGLPRKVMAYSDDAADVEAAELVEELLDQVDLDDVLLDLLDAVAQGFSVAEILWELGSQFRPVAVEHVSPRRFVWDQNNVRLLTEAESRHGEALAANKFVVHVHKARSGVPYRGGAMRPAAWLYLFKNYALKDWVAFVEIFGQPLRLGKYDPAASKEDRDALMAAVQAIGTDAAGVIANTTSIDFVSGSSSGSSSGSVDLYLKLLDWLDRGLSKIVLGQTLTTDTSGGTGTMAAGSVHNEVRRDLIEADAKAVAKSLQRDLIKPIVGFNFGWERTARLPYLEFDLSEPEDQKATAETYAILVKDLGLPISADHVRERFSVPAPAKGDELVSGPKSSAPASADANGGGTAPTQATEVAPLKGRTPRGALVLSSGSGPTIDADKLEAIIAASLPEGGVAVDEWVAEISAAVDQANDFSELQRLVLERYPNLKLDTLRAALDNAMAASAGHGAVLIQQPTVEPWRPLPFDQAQAFFASKTPMTPEAFKALSREAQAGAFTVSGIARDDLMKDVYTSIQRAVAKGITLADFRKDISGVLKAQGWAGRENRWRVETIFRTNVLTAYNAGHYQAMASAPTLKYWQYDAVGDSSTRHEHAAMDGRVFEASDPIWDTWYPPNGFNCRCTVRAMGEAELRARGLEVDTGRAYETIFPDPGFGTNPGKSWQSTLATRAAESKAGLRDLVASSAPENLPLFDEVTR